MLQKTNLLKYAFFSLAAMVFLMFISAPGGFFSSDAAGEPEIGPTGARYLVSQGIKGRIGDIKSTVDLAGEADSKGFKIIHIPQQIFTTFQVIAKGTPVARVPVPLYGTTTEGVVYLHAILPTNAPREGSDVFVWKNGRQAQLQRAAKAESEIAVQVPLDQGQNYLSFLVKSGNQWWGRSRVLRIESPGVEEKKDPPPTPPQDYWEEANSKGFNPPRKDSIIPFLGMTVTSRGNIVTDLPQPLSGSTGEGVVDSNLRLPNNLSGAGNSVYIWNNGEETLVSRSGRSSQSLLSKIVLSRGHNYVCATVKNGAQYVGRSPMMRINSTVTASIARFEMIWDGNGDMDLHLDSESAGWHVSYANRNVDHSGYRANLDVDNMSGFGPENIRVFSVPGKTTVRCFVNYYSGGSTLNVTVRHYDKNNKMVRAETRNFTPGMTRGTSAFNEKSWAVGTFEIEP